jgi:hypothetical protein
MNRQQRRKARLPKPGRHPLTDERVHDLSSAQLRSRLVQDAAGGIATPMEWAVNAYIRIAALDGISKDAAWLSVRQEIESLGAVMPEAPGS